MAGVNQSSGQSVVQEEPRKLPDMLNVLTILTLIACGLGGLWCIYGYFTARSGYEKLVQLQGSVDSMPDYARRFITPDAIEMARKAYENRLPIFILSLISYVLCAYGAIQMREYKKSGFALYLVGELLPLVATIIFLSAGAFLGFGLFGLVIPAVFIILYATQLKYLR
jgi:hypothetical protein